MAESKTIFMVFIICLLCQLLTLLLTFSLYIDFTDLIEILYFDRCFHLIGTLLVSVSGIQANPSCTTSRECELVCFRRTGRRDGICEGGMCACLSQKPKTEMTKTILCKKDRDCPSSSECPKDYYYSCLHGECTCIAV